MTEDLYIALDLHDRTVPWPTPSLEDALEDDSDLYSDWLPCLLTFRVGDVHFPQIWIPILQAAMMLPAHLRSIPDGRAFTWSLPEGEGYIRFTRNGDLFYLDPEPPPPTHVSRDQALQVLEEMESAGRAFLLAEHPALLDHPVVGRWLRGGEYQFPEGWEYPDPISS